MKKIVDAFWSVAIDAVVQGFALLCVLMVPMGFWKTCELISKWWK